MENQIPQKLITGQSFHSSFCFWSGPGLYSLLPSVSSSVEHPSQRHIQHKSHRHQTRTLFPAQHQGHKGQKGREQGSTRPVQPLALWLFEEVFLSRALALCTEVSKEKHSCLTKSTCFTSVCKKWKKIMLYHIFSTSLELSKEQGTWKQLFIESTADSRRLGWEGQHEIHKLHFFPDLVL